MGASNSKLVFKQGIFKLAESRSIPEDDPYWAGFWELPESQEDVFSLFSATDIRRVRDDAFSNLETLILAVTSRLRSLVNNPSFPHPELAPERHALNCIRILTRLLPFIYEADHLESWEDTFFWGERRDHPTENLRHASSEVLFQGTEDGGDARASDEEPGQDAPKESESSKPLAEELVDNLIKLLYYSDFTIPKIRNRNNVSYTIWQSGVGCNSSIATSQEMESRRMEVLRLLLTLTSKSMYTSTNVLPIQGIQAITYITTISDKHLVLTLLCSLLNTTLKYNPASWRVPYDHVVFKDPKQLYVTYCLQLLLVLVLYPVPETENGVPPKNYFRHFLGRLHRPQDFQFLVDGMTRILNQPLQATSSYLPGSQKSVTWAPEMVMLFWEVLQCNKRFRSFIVDTDRAHDFVVLIVFHAMQNRNDPSKQGVLRMCIFVLQTLSVEVSFGSRLNKTFQGQESLPQIIRIPNFRGSYADFLTISIYTIITSSKGKIDAVYPALLAIINNIAPYVQNLNSQASLKLVQLFTTMSSPSFLLANESNHHLLRSLLEAINAILEHHFDRNTTFVLAIAKAHGRFEALRDLTIEGGQSELDRRALLRKEAAEEVDHTSLSRVSSSLDSTRSPVNSQTSTLSNVPEEGGAFAIGDDEDSDDDGVSRNTPAASSRQSIEDSGTLPTASFGDEALPTQLRGMSEKARGKLPAHQASFSRVTSNASLNSMSTNIQTSNGNFEPSAAWIDNWLMELPLHTILTVIEQVLPRLTGQGASGTTTRMVREMQIQGIDRSPIRVHLFEWSPLSLGWYESLLWSFIFSTEVTLLKGAPGMWKGTKIKLFRVQETAAQGPSLLAPQGAIDSVGNNLVKRIESLNLRVTEAIAPPRSNSGGHIRDV